jgi:predicted ATPase/DNA-binding XRE family transcriptional regulator
MAGPSRSFGARLKVLREAAGFTQEELATIAGLSVHAISALERGERRRPHLETVRALSAALDLPPEQRDALIASARGRAPALATEIGADRLPLAPTPMLGRDPELRRLRQWIADPAARLISIVGPGGVGKTRLAIAIAQEIALEGTSRVVFVALASLRDKAVVASTIAESFALADTAGDALPDRLRVVCHNVPTWMVLDNFEHLMAAAPLVAMMLAAVPSLRILVTSRAPLHLRGEREFALNPLGCGTDADEAIPTELARAPAVRLFLDRIRDLVPDFRLTAANAASVRAICVRLDGLPLALELASRWMKVLPIDELLRRLKDPERLSAAAPLDAPERHRTMTAAVAWSVQLLAPDEQRALRRFGALPGRFSIDAAAAVLQGETDANRDDDAVRLVAGLLDKGLILRAETSAVPTRPAYYMLETVRAYALSALNAAGEYDNAVSGLEQYCRIEASRAAEGLIGPSQVAWLDRAREDLESYRATLAWLIEQGEVAKAAAIAWSLLMFLVIRGHATEGRRWFETLLDHPLSSAAEVQSLIGAGTLQYLHGDLPLSHDTLLRAVGLSRDHDLPSLHAHAAMILGHVEYSMGNFEMARTLFAMSARQFHGRAEPWVVGNALGGLAWVALAEGDRAEAEQRIHEAAGVLGVLGPWFRALGNYLSALLAVQAGDANRALSAVRESLVLLRETQDRFGVMYAFAPLAGAASLLREDGWVARLVGASDALTERSGVRSVDPMGQKLWDRARLGAQTRLGPEKWARAYEAGRRSSIDLLLNEINRAFQRTE